MNEDLKKAVESALRHARENGYGDFVDGEDPNDVAVELLRFDVGVEKTEATAEEVAEVVKKLREENKEPLFCMWCGEKMKMRYPGGDPENGPAERRCSKQNHTTVKEEVYDAWASRKLGEILSDAKDDLDTVLMYANPFVSSTEDLEDISKRLGVLAKEIDAKIEENDVQTLEWEKSVNKIDWEK